jgi:hypothetical protein
MLTLMDCQMIEPDEVTIMTEGYQRIKDDLKAARANRNNPA